MEKYIGYGYTNSSGIATLDYDSTGSSISPSGYTGVGAGEVDFRCKLHDDSTIVSQPCPVVDAQFIDMVNGTDNANAIHYNNCSKSVVDGVKTVTGTSSSNWGDVLISSTHYSDDVIYFNLPFKVKIEITDILSDFLFSVKTNGQSNVYGDWNTATGVYELEVSTNSLIIKRDGTWIASKTGNISSSARVGIHMKPLQSVTYKNLQIYPI